MVPASEKMAAVRAAKGKKAAPVSAPSEPKMSKKEMMAMMKKMMTEDSDDE
jgi:hypothetical protein